MLPNLCKNLNKKKAHYCKHKLLFLNIGAVTLELYYHENVFFMDHLCISGLPLSLSLSLALSFYSSH